MSKLITIDERKKYRETLKNLEELETSLDDALFRNKPLDDRVRRFVETLTATTDVEGQLQAVGTFKQQMRDQYDQRLLAAATRSLSCFVEYMTPDEPPAYHHEWMCKHMEGVEAREIPRSMISMPPGHAKDLDINTLVTMGDGSKKKLGDVQVGDFVITKMNRSRMVTAIHPKGKRPCLTIKTDLGRTILANHEHPFLTPSGWIEAQYLKTGNILAVSHSYDMPENIARKDSEYKLLGYLVGDGSVTQTTPLFTNADEGIVEDFLQSCKDLGFENKEGKKRSNARQFTISKASEWIKETGIQGLNSHTKRIPQWVFQSSNRQIALFLGAYFSCDGTVAKKGKQRRDCYVELVSVSRGLLEDCLYLFSRLGVRGRIATKFSSLNGKKHVAYRLTMTSQDDVARFHSIGFIAGDKWNRLNEWGLQDPIRFLHPLYFEDKIISIEETDPVPMKCLTVDEDSSFLAEDVVVHNSKFCSKYFPAWYLGKHGSHKFIQGGHSQDFVEKEFGAVVRSIVKEERYRNVFPDIAISSDSSAAGYWRIAGRTGSYLAKGAGQGIAGFRGNIACVDDPFAKMEDAESATIRDKVFTWFTADFMTRLLPNSPIFIVSTRWHSDDLCGRMEKLSNDPEYKGIPWTVINLPAFADTDNDPLGRKIGDPLWPDYYDKEFLDNLMGTLPPKTWNSLYMGRPSDLTGGVVNADMFSRYDELPRVITDPVTNATKNTIKRITLSVDTASKVKERNDFTVITVWIQEVETNKHYLAEVIRKRLEFDDMVKEIDRVASKWKVNEILVEDKGSGTQYIQVRKNRTFYPITAITPKGDKEFRFDGIIPMLSTGMALLPKRAMWLPEYEAELIAFPNGKFDDQVDATSQYLEYVRRGATLGTKKLKGIK